MTEDSLTPVSPGRDRIRLGPSQRDTGVVLDPRRSIAEPARWMIRTPKGRGTDVVLNVDCHNRFHAPGLFPVGPSLARARFVVPPAPGLGGDVDENALYASPARDVQAAPMLRRHDGFVTNW